MPAPIDPRGATTGRGEHLQRLLRPWGPTQAAGKQINDGVTRQVQLHYYQRSSREDETQSLGALPPLPGTNPDSGKATFSKSTSLCDNSRVTKRATEALVASSAPGDQPGKQVSNRRDAHSLAVIIIN